MTACVMCDDAITNPVCPACLHKGVEQWLFEQQETRMAKDVQSITRCDYEAGVLNADGDAAHNTHCIKCHNPMSVCAYCYSKDVFDIIKAKPLLVAEFMMFFNFDLEHLGWEQDARNLLADY